MSGPIDFGSIGGDLFQDNEHIDVGFRDLIPTRIRPIEI